MAPRPPRPSARVVGSLSALGLGLAVLLGVQLTDSALDPWQDEEPPAPAAQPTEAPLADGFAWAVRGDLPTLDISLGNRQLEAEAQAVCDALAVAPMAEVYEGHDVPVTTPVDAARFIGMSVAWRCPTHMAALSELTG